MGADSKSSLSVMAISMSDFLGSFCSLNDLTGTVFYPDEGEVLASNRDGSSSYCGYYVQYEWDGDDDVWFKVYS